MKMAQMTLDERAKMRMTFEVAPETMIRWSATIPELGITGYAKGPQGAVEEAHRLALLALSEALRDAAERIGLPIRA